MMKKITKFFLTISLLTFFGSLAMGAAFQYGGLRNDITSQSATTSTIVLSNASTQILRVTGTATTGQVVLLTNATTLQAGYWYEFLNESAGPLTISNSASTALCVASAGTASAESAAKLYLSSNSTAGGPWGCAVTTPAAVGCIPLVGSNPAVNWSAGNCFVEALGSNSAITFNNVSPGQVVNLRFTNTASNYTLTWPTTTPYTVKWPTGTAPVLTTGAHSDVYSCWFDNVASLIWCTSVQNY